MTALNTEQLNKVMSGGKKKVMTDVHKELIHQRINKGISLSEIAKELNGRDDWKIKDKKNTYNYVFNYLKRQLNKK